MAGRRCVAETKAGRRCRAWAVRGSEVVCGEPRCVAHGGRRGGCGREGGEGVRVVEGDGGVVVRAPALYARYFTAMELSGLAVYDDDEERSVAGEIAFARVFLSRLLSQADAEMGLVQLLRVAPMVAALLRALGYLVQVERDMGGAEPDAMETIMLEALTELGEEWGMDLVGER